MELWQQSPTGKWEIQEENGNSIAALTQEGAQLGGVRRPTAYLLLSQYSWSNCTITFKAKTLEPASITQRDIVVIFGYVDATHFYYTHISSDSDDKFHNIIMKVSGDTRSVIDEQSFPEARLTDNWHHIKVEHHASGSIGVYIDDFQTPLMTAQDQDYPSGAVGFGSFDDRALFDDVSIQGNLSLQESPR